MWMFGCSQRIVLLMCLFGTVDDGNKFCFESSTTNQESVDVVHGVKLIAVCCTGRPAVDDASFGTNGRGDVLTEPFTDLFVSILGLMIHENDRNDEESHENNDGRYMIFVMLHIHLLFVPVEGWQ